MEQEQCVVRCYVLGSSFGLRARLELALAGLQLKQGSTGAHLALAACEILVQRSRRRRNCDLRVRLRL